MGKGKNFCGEQDTCQNASNGIVAVFPGAGTSENIFSLTWFGALDFSFGCLYGKWDNVYGRRVLKRMRTTERTRYREKEIFPPLGLSCE